MSWYPASVWPRLRPTIRLVPVSSPTNSTYPSTDTIPFVDTAPASHDALDAVFASVLPSACVPTSSVQLTGSTVAVAPIW